MAMQCRPSEACFPECLEDRDRPGLVGAESKGRTCTGCTDYIGQAREEGSTQAADSSGMA